MASKHKQVPGREAFWRQTLKRHATSGLTIRAFCRHERLSEASFYFWRRAIADRTRPRNGARQSVQAGPPQPAFVPVVVDEDPKSAISIELAGGRVLRLPESISVERLAELVHALEARAER